MGPTWQREKGKGGGGLAVAAQVGPGWNEREGEGIGFFNKFSKLIFLNLNSILLLQIIIITFFIYFFPVVSGYRVSKEYIDNTKWLKTWIY